MAELAEELQDLNSSKAYKILEDQQRDGTLTKQDVDLYKSKYAKLHEFVLQTYSNELGFRQKTRDLRQKLMAEKVKLEQIQLEAQAEEKEIEKLTGQNQEVQNEYEVVQERDMMLQINITELEHERKEKLVFLQDRILEREAEAEPLLKEARDEVENLQKEIDLMRQQEEAHVKSHKEYEARLAALEQDCEVKKNVQAGHEREQAKVKADPDRIRKQAEKFESAVKNLTQSHAEKKAEIESATESLKRYATLQRDADEARKKANLRLTVIKGTANASEASVEEVKKRYDKERKDAEKYLMRRITLDEEMDELNIEHRQAQAELSQLNKMYEKLKRQFKKTQSIRDTVAESLGPLEQQKKDINTHMVGQNEEIKRQRDLMEDIQKEVDLFIGAYLKQESLEKEKKEQYEEILQDMQQMQTNLRTLQAQEQQWNSHFKTLTSQREKLARDASAAHRQCREAAEDANMKQLYEDDLKKKHQEISQKQQNLFILYEAVKNKRNQHRTSIQKSSQQLSEMKERQKILENEVDILRMEGACKDKELQHLRQDAQRLDVIHDQLQNEKMKISSRGAQLNEQVEQYLNEIEKLNTIINSIEREMISLRRKYEQAVETRNFTGTQLIDRNDELCILWEKSNIHEKLLKRGEDAMLARSEEIRGLQIDLQEVQRQLRTVEKKIPEVPALAQEVVRLREQVSQVKKHSEWLSRQLENPKSSLRNWRRLEGEDPDPQTLRNKIQELEERLNNKKEALLEKELVLEEVTALSEKLRQQASDGRQGTMELSQKVNVFQARIKDVTRKMMATVSELSMYQATSHKLEKERDEACDRAMEAQQRTDAGLPPTDTANAEFEKIMAHERQREVDRHASLLRKQEEDMLNSNLPRTSAEPRVNAYIPEDEHGLPKAYGAHAPFKPTIGGSTMRHIRKPNPKPIEL